MMHLCWYNGPNGERGWRECPICEGRIHLRGCTSKINRWRDCCAARHKMLHDAGQVKGIVDSSYFMWSPAYPEGYHPNDAGVGE